MQERCNDFSFRLQGVFNHFQHLAPDWAKHLNLSTWVLKLLAESGLRTKCWILRWLRFLNKVEAHPCGQASSWSYLADMRWIGALDGAGSTVWAAEARVFLELSYLPACVPLK